jgi:hypothetical protein
LNNSRIILSKSWNGVNGDSDMNSYGNNIQNDLDGIRNLDGVKSNEKKTKKKKKQKQKQPTSSSPSSSQPSSVRSGDMSLWKLKPLGKTSIFSSYSRILCLENLDDDEDPFMIDSMSYLNGLILTKRFYKITGVSIII